MKNISLGIIILKGADISVPISIIARQQMKKRY
jgi:hypothetical protein